MIKLTTVKRTRNYTIDAARLVFSLGVVFIHVFVGFVLKDLHTLWNYHWINPMARMGVPFFATVTGYLMSFKLASHPKYALDKAEKTAPLYIKLTAFYIFTYLIRNLVIAYFKHRDLVLTVENFFTSRDLKDYLVGMMGDYHLWYLQALIFALIIFHFVNKYFEIRPITFYIAAFFYVHSVFETIPVYEDIAEICMFMTLGYLVGLHRPQVKWISLKLMISFILYYACYFIDYTHPFYNILSIFVMYYLLNLFLAHNLPDNPISRIGRVHSHNIYYYHMFGHMTFKLLNTYFFKIKGVEAFVAWDVLYSVLLSILIGWLVAKFKARQTKLA